MNGESTTNSEPERKPRPHGRPTERSPAQRGTVGSIVGAGVRLLADLLVVSLWVLLLTLLFLATGWPRWAFYALLLVGVGLYVTVTAGWWGSDDPEKNVERAVED